MLEFELKHISENKKYIAGIDEAGRGPLAGPVVCACVIMPLDEESIIEGINDSKKLSEKKREMLFEKIIERAIDYKVVFIDEKTIDDINILNATKKGMVESVNGLKIKPDVVLIDAVKLTNLNVETQSIIKGDSLSYSIACASILAKVSRDRFMLELAKKFPEYGFEKHKGYGTKLHLEKIVEHGPTEIHRKSFLKNILKTIIANF